MSKLQCIASVKDVMPICRPLFVILVLILLASTSLAADKSTNQESAADRDRDPIVITAEQLSSDNTAKFAEFIGSVKATQSDFVITSDRLRIYFKGELLNTGKKGDTEEVLKKIVASGNVKITTEQYAAHTEELEYDLESMTIMLIGENSRVIDSQNNSISGSKIILHQKTGRVKVLGSKNKRIKAEFYSKDKTSEAFKVGTPKKE